VDPDLWAPDAPPAPFELATGLLYGSCPVADGRDRARGAAVESPRAALEALIRPALARAPCVVGFSGGRDSSALLAVAVALARREGWPEPVPVTLEYDSERTFERPWQEMIIAHLQVEQWVRLKLTDELDFVGPIAAEGLRRHGVLFPANAHMIVPLAREARGGSLLTGVGGDDTFGQWPWYDLGDLLAGRRRMRRGDVRRAAHALAPRRLRAEVLRRRAPLLLPWLRAEIRHEAALRIALELSRVPSTWAARMQFSARWRAWRAAAWSVALLGSDHGVAVHSPFLESSYFAALARAGGRWGWGGRTETMRALFGDVVPEALISRRGKAEFSEPMFSNHTRSFAGRWDGRSGIDAGLVDGEVLSRIWTADRTHSGSAMALQAAWLASQPATSVPEAEPVGAQSVASR
jgi:asparagine synthetase B (glutamine-hydrolysing)